MLRHGESQSISSQQFADPLICADASVDDRCDAVDDRYGSAATSAGRPPLVVFTNWVSMAFFRS